MVAKAAFLLTPERTIPMAEPPALILADSFHGDAARSPLLHEQDIAPFKPRTDLIIRGFARSFQGKPRRDWPVCIAIPDRLRHEFHVRGPSYWQREAGQWRHLGPNPVTEVPLSYALAFGGAHGQGEQTVFHAENPAGLGFMTPASARDLEGWYAPQIGLLAEFMAARPFEPLSVRGTGPIAKGWLPRRALAGTFDADWQRDRHPRMPADYDLAFWNMAPGRMQIGPYLQGGEALHLTGISHLHETLVLNLPLARLAILSRSDHGQSPVPMVLDTVDLDIAAIDQGQASVTLIWRAVLPDRFAFAEAEIIRG